MEYSVRSTIRLLVNTDWFACDSFVQSNRGLGRVPCMRALDLLPANVIWYDSLLLCGG